MATNLDTVSQWFALVIARRVGGGGGGAEDEGRFKIQMVYLT